MILPTYGAEKRVRARGREKRPKKGQTGDAVLGFLKHKEDFRARGIQTRSFGAGWADFVLEFFQMFHLYTGGQFLLPQRANSEKREILPTFKMDETQEFEWLGHSNWTNCNHLS